MGQHSVAEAKNKLSELIDRAEKGEEVVITRHGHPVIAFKVIGSDASRIMTDAELDWLAERRKKRGRIKDDAGAFVSRMRDEEWR
ncbi:MAG TPA: type II toxin-antitoxin system prevent-host-death family antitoxin [Rhizomicrobium sp.]|jgi:prevent-host-death family protein